MTNTDHEALMDHHDSAIATGEQAVVEGGVVDIAGLRKYPEDQYVESGYALVGEGGRAHLSDADATPKIMRVLDSPSAEAGVYVRVERRLRDGEMVTDIVSATQPPGSGPVFGVPPHAPPRPTSGPP